MVASVVRSFILVSSAVDTTEERTIVSSLYFDLDFGTGAFEVAVAVAAVAVVGASAEAEIVVLTSSARARSFDLWRRRGGGRGTVTSALGERGSSQKLSEFPGSALLNVEC